MKNFLWALAIVIILGGGYLFWQSSTPSAGVTPTPTPSSPSPEPTPTPTPVPSTRSTDSGSPRGIRGATSSGQATPTAPMSATVTYSASGFSPSEVTIKKGGTVTWTNSSGGQMWIASAQHPSHVVYAGTSREEHCPDATGAAFDQCAGSTGDYSFTFQKVGTWNYHDHLNAQKFGKVVVVVE